MIFASSDERARLIQSLKENNVMAVFHYLSLHKGLYHVSKHDGRELQNAYKYSDRLLRLLLFYNVKKEEVEFVIKNILEFNGLDFLFSNCFCFE